MPRAEHASCQSANGVCRRVLPLSSRPLGGYLQSLVERLEFGTGVAAEAAVNQRLSSSRHPGACSPAQRSQFLGSSGASLRLMSFWEQESAGSTFSRGAVATELLSSSWRCGELGAA